MGNSPACAGTTRRSRSGSSTGSEQPRVCGDDCSISCTLTAPTGTAPRARGRHVLGPDTAGRPGNSPACAGTTPGRRRRGRRHWEQPRVRGDDPGRDFSRRTHAGTAPRARGRRSPTTRPGSSSGEQPRVRGDDDDSTIRPRMRVGTAPRARGRLLLADLVACDDGNSPACAGTTLPDLRRYERQGRFSFTSSSLRSTPLRLLLSMSLPPSRTGTGIVQSGSSRQSRLVLLANLPLRPRPQVLTDPCPSHREARVPRARPQARTRRGRIQDIFCPELPATGI